MPRKFILIDGCKEKKNNFYKSFIKAFHCFENYDMEQISIWKFWKKSDNSGTISETNSTIMEIKFYTT